MTEQFRPRGFSLLPMIVKNLLIINGLVFVAQLVAEKSFGISLEDILGLHYPGAMAFKPWQLLTYMFLHSTVDYWHLLFNMFALWMFGYALENIWGPRRFLIYYLITGIGAALVQCLVMYIDINPTVVMLNEWIVNPDANSISGFFSQYSLLPQNFQEALNVLKIKPEDKQSLLIVKNFLVDFREYFMNQPNVIGASGAVFGILLAFGMLFPNTLIYIYFLFPLKAKYFVIFYGLIEVYLIYSGGQPNVAHFAHLGGMIFGFFLILYWKKKGRLY